MSDEIGAGYLLIQASTVQSILDTGVLLTKDTDELRRAVAHSDQGVDGAYSELAHRLVASIAPYLARALEGEAL